MKFNSMLITLNSLNKISELEEELKNLNILYEIVTDKENGTINVYVFKNNKKVKSVAEKYGNVSDIATDIEYRILTLKNEVTVDSDIKNDEIVFTETAKDIERAIALFSERKYGNRPAVLIKHINLIDANGASTQLVCEIIDVFRPE